MEIARDEKMINMMWLLDQRMAVDAKMRRPSLLELQNIIMETTRGGCDNYPGGNHILGNDIKDEL